MSYEPGRGGGHFRTPTPWTCALCASPPVGRRGNALLCELHLRHRDFGNGIVTIAGTLLLGVALSGFVASLLGVFSPQTGFLCLIAAGMGASLAAAAWKDLP